jgi:hypothetical protein
MIIIMKRLIIAQAIAMAVFLSGCSQRLMDFTVVSSKNIDLSKGADFKRSPSRVTGEDKKGIFMFIPMGRPNAKEALDRAIEKVPGAVALTDGVITSKWWWIPYIYGESTIEVEGTPLIDPNIEKTYRK